MCCYFSLERTTAIQKNRQTHFEIIWGDALVLSTKKCYLYTESSPKKCVFWCILHYLFIPV